MSEKSAFDTPWFNSQDKSFFNHLNQNKTPHLILTAETEDFDENVIRQWRQEGFDTIYIPLINDISDYIKTIHSAGDSFGVGESYAIVAYGDAASHILEAHLKPNNPRLCGIIAYYPSTIPSGNTRFPPSVKVLVHLAGATDIGVRHTSQVLGIQGKRKTVRKRVDPGLGHGGSLRLGYHAYTYAGAEPGFAEHDLDEYDSISKSLAFSRSLATLHKAFRIEPRIEEVRDGLTDAVVRGAGKEVSEYLLPESNVLFASTHTGATGSDDVGRFYSNIFNPLPPTCSWRLLSRTIGTDRVVDELFLSLAHSQPIDWLLPGVPATGCRVEIVIVSILCVRGGKMESEHVYWDQASVLAQVGLLDPKLAVPTSWRKKGVTRLPIVGADASRAVGDKSSSTLNHLLED